MKWFLTAIAMVIAVAIRTSQESGVEPLTHLPLPISNKNMPSAIAPESMIESSLDMAPPPEVPNFSKAEQADGGVINIGEPMNPDDLYAWSQQDNTEVINIGEPMDPDVPSTWSEPENTEPINIGEPIDPDDPAAWYQ